MGSIKCGFWKTKFILSPYEFKGFLDLCAEYKIKFIVPSYYRPEHSIAEVLEVYTAMYNRFVNDEEPQSILYALVYSMKLDFENYSSSFHLVLNGVHFYKNNTLVHNSRIPFLEISFPKGEMIIKEDEKGEYFVYEDINLYKPEMYPIFEKLSNQVKLNTKPLRFLMDAGVGTQEIKPSAVRISERAAKDFATSWLFRHYELKMKSFT